jgi:hypothetical protein
MDDRERDRDDACGFFERKRSGDETRAMTRRVRARAWASATRDPPGRVLVIHQAAHVFVRTIICGAQYEAAFTNFHPIP